MFFSKGTAIRKCTKTILIARIMLIVLILANLTFIWYNSSKVSKDSDKTSKKIASTVAKTVVDDYETLSKPVQKKYVNKYNRIIRSVGHFLEFVPLGMLLFLLAVALFDFGDKKMITIFLTAILFSSGLSLISALTDEIHQLFVKGRTFQTIDILTDTFGAICGSVAAWLFVCICKKKIFK